MNIVEEACAFAEKAKSMSKEILQEAMKALPKSVQEAYLEMCRSAYFVPENEVVGSRKEVFSPSGKYKLVISEFSTKPGSWSYSQGVVYGKDNDKPIAIVQRNYHSFPNLFIEGHPKGDFLVCGKDYQGQTIIELTTGQRRDLMSDGSDKGWGFCWASYTFDVPNCLLVVCGCHWACPYEHRFYDFSDPMSDWSEVKPNDRIDADERKDPELDADGTMRAFKTRYTDDDDEMTDEERAKLPNEPIVDVILTYKRAGLEFKLVEEWVSDYEEDSRIKRAEWERKDREWVANFKATDPLYLAYALLVKGSDVSPQDYYEGCGKTYEGWGDGWSGNERRWCRRIIAHKGLKGPAVDLEWAVDTGPIKLVFFRDGKSDGHQFFEHSVDGMNLAFERAKEYSELIWSAHKRGAE
jgi:hypothetical protein